jgi:threonine aldolase
MDGARLGYGLCSYETDLTLPEIAKLCDIFYIGGTKMGALCGEAIVFTKNAPAHFFTMIKQHGALTAKGRLLGVQFDALFTDALYFEIGKHAIDMAEKLKKIFEEKGYRFFMQSPTNQQFVILENEKMKELKEKVTFSIWEPYDENHTVVRFATAWSTTDEDLEALKAIL